MEAGLPLGLQVPERLEPGTLRRMAAIVVPGWVIPTHSSC